MSDRDVLREVASAAEEPVREIVGAARSVALLIAGMAILGLAALVAITLSGIAGTFLVLALVAALSTVGLDRAIAPLVGPTILVLIVAATFLVVVAVYRRLPQPVRDAFRSTADERLEAVAPARPPELSLSLAELDARFAPPATPAEAQLVARTSSRKASERGARSSE